MGISLLLAGCLKSPESDREPVSLKRPAAESIAVANRSVVIGGPSGYCIDRGASRLGGDTAFVLLGSCASISRNASADAPARPGILTASVAKRGDEAIGLDLLEGYVGSDSGKAALARDGQAGSVQILGTVQRNEALFIHLTDTSPNGTPGLEETYWRALFELNGRLITASVVSFSNRPLSAQGGFDTLSAFLTRIRQETPAETTQYVENNAPKDRRGVLQKLFR